MTRSINQTEIFLWYMNHYVVVYMYLCVIFMSSIFKTIDKVKPNTYCVKTGLSGSLDFHGFCPGFQCVGGGLSDFSFTGLQMKYQFVQKFITETLI